MMRLIGLLVLGVGALVSACMPTSKPAKTEMPMRVISLDYCADQYVLKFVPRDRIVGVSPDAPKDFSYMRDAAEGIRRVPSKAEDVLALQPDLIVRSYGGGANAANYFEAAGVPVLQVGWARDLDGVEQVILDMAEGLGAGGEGRDIVADMQARLAALSGANSGKRALYMTPGGVTSGAGSLVHEMMVAAGLANYHAEAGWHDLPLEQLVADRPDLVAFAAFDTHVTPWSAARHPVAQAQIRALPVARLEGAWTSCGGWWLVDAIEVMAEAAR
jgi:iron complex transport system substrate-binding protein